MKNWRKLLALVLAGSMLVSMAACSSSTDDSTTTDDTSSSSSDDTTADDTTADDTTTDDTSADESADETVGSTPRNETLYYAGEQWSTFSNVNPFASSSNCFLMEQSEQSCEAIYETLYMFNSIDGELYPLLADGDPVWNDDQTELTVYLNSAAYWSDGTDFTSADVVTTWEMHVKHSTTNGVDYSQYISEVVAIDEYTVVFYANMDNFNPLKMLEVLPKIYIAQADYLIAADAEVDGDSETFKTLEMTDAPHTGAYEMWYWDETKLVAIRDDNYWGQDESMWGELPAPKYLAHNIFADNASGDTALMNGEVDVSQQYIANVSDMWETNDLPISTYIDEAPYQYNETMPSIFFNTTIEGLDQTAVRQAIAYAVDYDQIISTAMTNQSYSFSDYGRSLFNTTAAEREIYDAIYDDIADLQWVGCEYDRAIAVLDEAGIVDTNGDGNREYNGEELSFTIQCPTGWSDWTASCELVAAGGANIGITIETYFPDSATYYENIQTGNYDMAMSSPSGSSISSPWSRAYWLLYGFGGEFPETMSFSYSRLYDADVDAALAAISTETDEEKLLEYYTTLNQFYLEEVPSFSVMYRPSYFMTVNESVWTGFPTEGDGTNIPPSICYQGYGIAALYEIYLVDEA